MEQLITIRTNSQLAELIEYLQDKEYVAFDTETNGTDKDARIIGLSACTELDRAYYVIIEYWDVSKGCLEKEQIDDSLLLELIKALATKKLIMHNSVFDCKMVNSNFKIDLMPSVHTDTMLLGHILNENRRNGLKELGSSIFGDDDKQEQLLMKASVKKNGGVLTEDKYELYKADAELLAKYGAKDALLTLKLFYHLIPELFDQGLDKFFYEEESMPLVRTATYDLNTTGLRVDMEKLQKLRSTVEAEIMEQKAFIYKEIKNDIIQKYPGTSAKNTFNIDAPQQLSWLVFYKLGNEFGLLTDSGKEVCQALGMRIPYTYKAKAELVAELTQRKGHVYEEAVFNPKTGKMGRPKKIKDWWTYTQCGEEELSKIAERHKWVKTLLEYKKNTKLLSTYIIGIQSRTQYSTINPSFLQHGTTSGRYASRDPNFQNLPREDKRIKSCIISRPGKVFIGADYSQLEPRVFASVSGDEILLDCFKSGKDFYSVIGMDIFDKDDCSPFKSAPDSFASKYSSLRDDSKQFALATPYGTTAFQQARKLDKKVAECEEIIDKYFQKYPKVELMMLESHEQAKANGVVHSLFGRPRRIPEAKTIREIYGDTPKEELPYNVRSWLNLAMNHRIQSTAASIVNRAAIAVKKMCNELAKDDPRWDEVKVVLQVHDELVLESPVDIAEDASLVLKHCMEKTVELPGVDLIADPKIANNLADLK